MSKHKNIQVLIHRLERNINKNTIETLPIEVPTHNPIPPTYTATFAAGVDNKNETIPMYYYHL